MSGKIYVGDVGTAIICNCGEDVSTATSRKIKIKKPDGTEVEKDAEVYQTNYFKYVTVTGDLNLEGLYKVQPTMTLGSWSGSGETDEFQVYPPYDE